MDFIRGINFAVFPRRGLLSMAETRESLDHLIDTLHPNLIILTPAGQQRDAQSTQIMFDSEGTPTDSELEDTIRYIHARGVMTAIKPTVNCMNGTWRAYISFIEPDSPAEAKWGDWFASYTAFQLHYAGMAERLGCAMFITGCEMVMADHRSDDWRRLIAAVRQVYHGPVTYNCDKYREDHVDWWDCVDYICSSGYYPAGTWEEQLDRIGQVVQRFDKPFFFAELGCMAVSGAGALPNEWKLTGERDDAGQVQWYQQAITAAGRRPWMRGFAFWDWAAIPREPREPGHSYDLSISQALPVVAGFYQTLEEKHA